MHAAEGSAAGTSARERVTLFALFALVLASRAPLLTPGFGLDADGWLLADAARAIAETGRYQYSRPPGHPLQELVSSLFWRAAPERLALWLNGLGAAFTALCAVLLATLARRLGRPGGLALGVAFAFTPIVYVASTTPIDYAWAQALVLCGLCSALRGRSARAGIWIGLAIGARVTAASALAPLGYLLVRTHARGVRAAATLVATALALGALQFVPALCTYGLRGLWYGRLGNPPLELVLAKATVEVWGQVGLVAIALASALALVPRVARRAQSPRERALVEALGLGLVLELALFPILPHEAGYLIPAVALLLLLLGLRLARAPLALLCAALVLSGFVELRAGRPAPGPVLRDHAARELEQRAIERLLALRDSAPTRTAIVCGPWLEKLRWYLDARTPGRVRYVREIASAERFGELVSWGLAIHYVEGIEGWHAAVTGVDLRALGATPIAAPPLAFW